MQDWRFDFINRPIHKANVKVSSSLTPCKNKEEWLNRSKAVHILNLNINACKWSALSSVRFIPKKAPLIFTAQKVDWTVQLAWWQG